MPKSDEEIERELESVVGSMALSDSILSEKHIEDCRAILKGELDGDEAVQRIFEKYRLKNNEANGA